MIGRKTIVHLEKDAEYDSNASEHKNPVDALIGSRIRKRRIMLGYSETALSEALGVTEGQLAKWEIGVEQSRGEAAERDIGIPSGAPVSFL